MYMHVCHDVYVEEQEQHIITKNIRKSTHLYITTRVKKE